MTTNRCSLLMCPAGITWSVMLGVIAFPAAGDTPLGIEEVVTEALRNDPNLDRAKEQVNAAAGRYDLTLASTVPDLALTIEPYSYRRQRSMSSTEGAITETSAAAMGIELRQALSTSGTITAGIDHRFEVTSVEGEDDNTVEQTPQVRFGFEQPLFFADGIVGTSVFRAGRRSAEISYRSAAIVAEEQENGSILNAIGLFIETASLRRSVTLLEDTISLLQRQIETAQLDREEGLLSDTSILGLQVTLNERRETLFDTRLRLLDSEQGLARILGIEHLGERRIDDTLGTVQTDDLSESDLAGDAAENKTVRVERLAVEQARMENILNDLSDRPTVRVDVTTSPLYPFQREDPADAASSFSDYLEDDADISANVSVSLRIPLLTRRERDAQEAIDTTAEKSALIELNDTELATINRLRTLGITREFLLERQQLLETDIAYQERRLGNEEDLLASGASTQLRVDEIALDLASRRNEAWQVAAELYVNALEIAATKGEALSTLLRN